MTTKFALRVYLVKMIGSGCNDWLFALRVHIISHMHSKITRTKTHTYKCEFTSAKACLCELVCDKNIETCKILACAMPTCNLYLPSLFHSEV